MCSQAEHDAADVWELRARQGVDLRAPAVGECSPAVKGPFNQQPSSEALQHRRRASCELVAALNAARHETSSTQHNLLVYRTQLILQRVDRSMQGVGAWRKNQPPVRPPSDRAMRSGALSPASRRRTPSGEAPVTAPPAPPTPRMRRLLRQPGTATVAMARPHDGLGAPEMPLRFLKRCPCLLPGAPRRSSFSTLQHIQGLQPVFESSSTPPQTLSEPGRPSGMQVGRAAGGRAKGRRARGAAQLDGRLRQLQGRLRERVARAAGAPAARCLFGRPIHPGWRRRRGRRS